MHGFAGGDFSYASQMTDWQVSLHEDEQHLSFEDAVSTYNILRYPDMRITNENMYNLDELLELDPVDEVSLSLTQGFYDGDEDNDIREVIPAIDIPVETPAPAQAEAPAGNWPSTLEYNRKLLLIARGGGQVGWQAARRQAARRQNRMKMTNPPPCHVRHTVHNIRWGAIGRSVMAQGSTHIVTLSRVIYTFVDRVMTTVMQLPSSSMKRSQMKMSPSRSPSALQDGLRTRQRLQLRQETSNRLWRGPGQRQHWKCST